MEFCFSDICSFIFASVVTDRFYKDSYFMQLGGINYEYCFRRNIFSRSCLFRAMEEIKSVITMNNLTFGYDEQGMEGLR